MSGDGMPLWNDRDTCQSSEVKRSKSCRILCPACRTLEHGKTPDDAFFSFRELNRMIRQKLDAANERSFQKMEGSRHSVFEQMERHMFRSLPPLRPYELAEFKKACVAPDYHVEFRGNFYSVPYRFVKDTVEVRATARIVEVIRNGKRIASHSCILSDNKHRYNAIPDHMPESHRFQAE